MFGETFATINYFLSPEDFKDFRDLWKLYYMKKVAFVSIVWGYSDMPFTIFMSLKPFLYVPWKTSWTSLHLLKTFLTLMSEIVVGKNIVKNTEFG